MDITGNKVVLRTVEEQDQEMLLNLIEDPEAAKVTGGYPLPVSYDHQIKWFRSMENSADSLYRIIAERENPRNGLGIIILSHENSECETGEIYIKLMKSVRGKGYGQDSVKALVGYAFREMGIGHIYSNILENNISSRRLFEKCGFKQEDMYKSNPEKEGYCRKVCIYGIREKDMQIEEKTNNKRETANQEILSNT